MPLIPNLEIVQDVSTSTLNSSQNSSQFEELMSEKNSSHLEGLMSGKNSSSNQDFAFLINIIKTLQKTIEALNKRLEAFENQNAKTISNRRLEANEKNIPKNIPKIPNIPNVPITPKKDKLVATNPVLYDHYLQIYICACPLELDVCKKRQVSSN